MLTISHQTIIQQTKNWVEKFVIGLNLCPFAAQPFNNNAIEYCVNDGNSTEQHLHQLADSLAQLDVATETETSLLIYPQAYTQFDDYLDLLELANHLLDDLSYSGTYQLASFHPEYCFEGSTESDASNFTNRSPYPMLHLIRESSVEKAVAHYPDIEQLPQNNIKKLQAMGFSKLQDDLKKLVKL